MFILDGDGLVIAFQELLPRLWDLDMFLPQLVCPPLSKGVMMRDGLVAQLEVCRIVLQRMSVVTADAFQVRVVVDLRDLESQGDPYNSKCFSQYLM